MRRMLTISLGVLFVVVLLLFTVTYTVRFTEYAVLTTFGKAHGPEAIKKEPGLKFKWFYPVQSVTKYDTRLRWTETQLQTQQTRDERQVIVQAFCTWRVSDPLKFFQRFSNAGASADDHFRSAEDALRGALAASLAELGKFELGELFTRDPRGSRLRELEANVHAALSTGSTSGLSLAEYGVEAVNVGITRVKLPEATTKVVIERMTANRDRLAREIESKGEADSIGITSKADSDARRIADFAAQRAEDIRALGDREAAQFYKMMDTNPELAVFLKNCDLLREAFSKQATLVFPVSAPGMWLFSPNAMDGLRPGEIPPSNLPPRQPRANAQSAMEEGR